VQVTYADCKCMGRVKNVKFGWILRIYNY